MPQQADAVAKVQKSYGITAHWSKKSAKNSRNIWKIREKCLSLQRERRSQVEPRCAERWHGCGNTEMMSNSTLPLGFLHSNTELVTCGQLLYFPILGQRKLSRVFHSGCSNEVHLCDQFSANLHFVVRMNYKLLLPVCVDETFPSK